MSEIEKTPKIDKTYCKKCKKDTFSIDSEDKCCYKCSECRDTK